MQLTKQDLIDAMAGAGVGVVKTAATGTNADCTAPEALLTKLNQVLSTKTQGDK